MTHDATSFVPKTELGTLYGDRTDGPGGGGKPRQPSLQRAMKACHLLPGPASPGASAGAPCQRERAQRGVRLPRLFTTLLFPAGPSPLPRLSVICWIRGHIRLEWVTSLCSRG